MEDNSISTEYLNKKYSSFHRYRTLISREEKKTVKKIAALARIMIKQTEKEILEYENRRNIE